MSYSAYPDARYPQASSYNGFVADGDSGYAPQDQSPPRERSSFRGAQLPHVDRREEIKKHLAWAFKWNPWVMLVFYLSASVALLTITGMDVIGDAIVVEDRIGQQWWWANSYRITYFFGATLVVNAIINFLLWYYANTIKEAAGNKLRIAPLPLDFGVLSAVSQLLVLAASGKTEFGTLLFGSLLNLTGALLSGSTEYYKTVWSEEAIKKMKISAKKLSYQRRTQGFTAVIGGLLQATPYIFSLIWFGVGCHRGNLDCVSGAYVFVIGISTCVLIRIFLQVWSCFTEHNLGDPVTYYWMHTFFQVAIVCFAIPTMRNAFSIKDHLSVPNL